jgi:hypothetical protein
MTHNMRPICPSCGAEMEALRSDSHTTLSCSTCGWNSAPARRIYSAELLWAGLGAILLVVAGIHDSLASGLHWSDLALGTAIVGAATWFVARKPLRAYRRLAPSAKSAPQVSSGISGAPSAFAQLIPSREEAGDLFSGILNVARPRPVQWSWAERAAMAIGLFIPTAAIWTAYEMLHGNQDKGGLGILLLILVLYPAIRTRFPVVPAFSKLRLLQFAEVTVGRVVCVGKSTGGGINSNSLILYAFLDGAGRGFIGQGVDHTNSLGTGAPVVVFYEALDPARNVALECSRFTIKAHKGQLIRA